MKAVRITLSLAAAFFAVIFLIVALTVPAFAATAPMIAGITLAVVAFFLWPRKRKVAV